MVIEKFETRVVCLMGDCFSPSARFIIEIDLGAGLTQREQTILLNSARSCEVSKLLAGNIDLDYRLGS
jgi:hypothetical protein